MRLEISSIGPLLKFKDNQHIFYILKAEVKRISYIRGDTVKLETGNPSRDLYLKPGDLAPGQATTQEELAELLTGLMPDFDAANRVGMENLTSLVSGLLTQVADLQAKLFDLKTANYFEQPAAVDQTQGEVVFKGYVQATGCVDDAFVWAISKTVTTEGVIRVFWAEGTKDFDKRWARRMDYAYA